MLLPEILDTLLQRYPDIPSLGSPYPLPHWTPEFWNNNNRIFDPLESNQFKRVSSMTGDLLFESGRRVQLDDIARAGVPVWNYRFMQPPKDCQTFEGTYHSAENKYGECYITFVLQFSLFPCCLADVCLNLPS
jgi:hypothetical protein